MPSSLSSGLVVCGRRFVHSDIAGLRELIASNPGLSRKELARRTCQALHWVAPSGQLKEMSSRVALLRLEAKGFIQLPPPQRSNGNRKPFQPQHSIEVPAENVICSAGALSGLCLQRVVTKADSRLWNEAIARFHYLGYKRLPGAQMRYLVRSTLGLLGAVGFGASAWKAAPRDRWIGWSDSQRQARLHLVANNARFLLLPWIRCKNLASLILAWCARELPRDWQARYGYRPVVLETFVERDRFLGTSYKAANWQYVGDTQGRGKLDRHHQAALPVKQIYLYPLASDFRQVLCA